jgi:hypothetical protein
MYSFIRYRTLDVIRGFSILYVIFIHGAIYNYSRINDLDFAQLPVLLLVAGAVGLWGGVFVVYSLIVNTISSLRRSSKKRLEFKAFGYLALAGLLYILVVGSIQTLLLGRWSLGVNPDITVVAEIIRGQPIDIHLEKLLTGSGIKMIGINLLVVPLIMYAAFRKTGLRDESQNYLFFGTIGLLLLLTSFTRLFLYSDWVQALAEGNWVTGFIGSLFVADPYPGIAYLSYGFFGVALGMMLYYKRKDYLRRYMAPLGATLLLLGGIGMTTQPPDLFGASWFWYFKVIAEAGFFVAGFALVMLRMLGKQERRNAASLTSRLWGEPLAAVSRISLTAYLLETLTSELLRHVWFWFNPSWTGSIQVCLMFGFTNMAIWVAIALLWRRWNFRWSIEDLWVRGFASIGKQSTKLAA